VTTDVGIRTIVLGAPAGTPFPYEPFSSAIQSGKGQPGITHPGERAHGFHRSYSALMTLSLTATGNWLLALPLELLRFAAS
jgi:hypothetical protein